MKRKSVFFVTSLLFAMIIISGCANSGGYLVVNYQSELPSIQQKYSRQLSRLRIGMSIGEFRRIFPKACVGGQHEKMTAYELVDIQYYVIQSDINYQNAMWGFGSPKPRTVKRVLWFYFFDGKLTGWGRPQDWPANPQIVSSRENSYDEYKKKPDTQDTNSSKLVAHVRKSICLVKSTKTPELIKENTRISDIETVKESPRETELEPRSIDFWKHRDTDEVYVIEMSWRNIVFSGYGPIIGKPEVLKTYKLTTDKNAELQKYRDNDQLIWVSGKVNQ